MISPDPSGPYFKTHKEETLNRVHKTVVAVGTSVPELATAIIAKIRGHDEVSLGTVLGSNIFNGLFIIAVAAVTILSLSR